MAIFNLKIKQQALKAHWEKHILAFKNPAGTSRGVMLKKDCYVLHIHYENDKNSIGIGECSPIWGLSIDSKELYENTLQNLCEDINNYSHYLNGALQNFPSINFGLEMALKSLEQGGGQILFPSEFTNNKQSIKINGLIWMGELDFMQKQIQEKIDLGYDCIKLKIGALNFDTEIKLIQSIRKKYPKEQLEIRVDANGAFDFDNALEKLQKLAELDIHSIEQPIKAGNWDQMQFLCAKSPLSIALDEELIGVFSEQKELLQTIQPQYLILKPSLLGGFKATENWINLAEELNIKWWITSALESNIGLNAIAQFTFLTNNNLPQGLGTGNIYTSNIGKANCLKGDQFYFTS